MVSRVLTNGADDEGELEDEVSDEMHADQRREEVSDLRVNEQVLHGMDVIYTIRGGEHFHLTGQARRARTGRGANRGGEFVVKLMEILHNVLLIKNDGIEKLSTRGGANLVKPGDLVE